MNLKRLIDVSTALRDADVRFIICGGQAVVVHGYTRFTADLDIAIQLTNSATQATITALQAAGYRPSIPVTADQFANPETRESWARERNMKVLNFISDADPLGGIDIFVQDPFDFEAEYEAALSFELVPGLTWRVLRLDALIDMKRAVGRAVDMDDVDHLTAIKSMREGAK